jgi:hypothetical protein
LLAHERPSRAVVLEQGHGEVIHADEAPFDACAGTRRDRHRDRSFRVAATSPPTAAATATARDPEVLQLARIGDTSRKPFQVAARRMATAARRSEVRLSSRRSTDEHFLRRHRLRFRRPALATGLCEHTVQELRDRLDVLVRQCEGRHRRGPGRRIQTSTLDDRHDEIAGFVTEDELRSQQVRATQLPAAQINAVARCAIALVQPFPAREHASVSKRPLLLWEIRPAATTSGVGSALSSSTTGGRGRLLSHRVGRAHSDTQCDGTDQ